MLPPASSFHPRGRPRLPHQTPPTAPPPAHLQTDVFALGVILLQLATGLTAVLPGLHGSSPRLLANHLRDLLAKGARPKADPACSGTWTARSGAPVAGPAGSAMLPEAEEEEEAIVSGLIALGLRCTEHGRHMRPSVEEVQLALADLRSAGGGPSAYYARPESLTLGAAAADAPFAIAATVEVARQPAGGNCSEGVSAMAAGRRGLECVSCCEAERNSALLPCGHAVMCANCAHGLLRKHMPMQQQQQRSTFWPRADEPGGSSGTASALALAFGPGAGSGGGESSISGQGLGGLSHSRSQSHSGTDHEAGASAGSNGTNARTAALDAPAAAAPHPESGTRIGSCKAPEEALDHVQAHAIGGEAAAASLQVAATTRSLRGDRPAPVVDSLRPSGSSSTVHDVRDDVRGKSSGKKGAPPAPGFLCPLCRAQVAGVRLLPHEDLPVRTALRELEAGQGTTVTVA